MSVVRQSAVRNDPHDGTLDFNEENAAGQKAKMMFDDDPTDDASPHTVQNFTPQRLEQFFMRLNDILGGKIYVLQVPNQSRVTNGNARNNRNNTALYLNVGRPNVNERSGVTVALSNVRLSLTTFKHNSAFAAPNSCALNMRAVLSLQPQHMMLLDAINLSLMRQAHQFLQTYQAETPTFKLNDANYDLFGNGLDQDHQLNIFVTPPPSGKFCTMIDEDTTFPENHENPAANVTNIVFSNVPGRQILKSQIDVHSPEIMAQLRNCEANIGIRINRAQVFNGKFRFVTTIHYIELKRILTGAMLQMERIRLAQLHNIDL